MIKLDPHISAAIDKLVEAKLEPARIMQRFVDVNRNALYGPSLESINRSRREEAAAKSNIENAEAELAAALSTVKAIVPSRVPMLVNELVEQGKFYKRNDINEDQFVRAVNHYVDQALGPIPVDAIAVNLVRFAGLDKHKARECEAIVRQVLAATPAPAEPSQPHDWAEHGTHFTCRRCGLVSQSGQENACTMKSE